MQKKTHLPPQKDTGSSFCVQKLKLSIFVGSKQPILTSSPHLHENRKIAQLLGASKAQNPRPWGEAFSEGNPRDPETDIFAPCKMDGWNTLEYIVCFWDVGWPIFTGLLLVSRIVAAFFRIMWNMKLKISLETTPKISKTLQKTERQATHAF